MRHLIIADSLLALLMVLAMGWLYVDAQPTRLTVEEYVWWKCSQGQGESETTPLTPGLDSWAETRLNFRVSVESLDGVEPPEEFREHHEWVRHNFAAMRDFADSYETTSANDGINAMILDMQADPERYFPPDPDNVDWLRNALAC